MFYKNLVIQGEGGIKFADKTDAAKGRGGWGNADMAYKGSRGVGERLKLADEGGGGLGLPIFG